MSWLREIRDAEGVTTYQVAEDAGIAQSYYATIETGRRSPGVDVARRLGRRMGFDWRRFYGAR